jgi:hypothetical protein
MSSPDFKWDKGLDKQYSAPTIKKYKMDPSIRKARDTMGLLKLESFKNVAGEFYCFVMYKVFYNSNQICVTKTTGNIFSGETIKERDLKQDGLVLKRLTQVNRDQGDTIRNENIRIKPKYDKDGSVKSVQNEDMKGEPLQTLARDQPQVNQDEKSLFYQSMNLQLPHS